MTSVFLLCALLFIVAFLYSSVGHGGASGYLAVMALLSIAPAMMKSSALIMNVFVSLFSFYGFYKAGHFKFNLFWPLALASIPAAYYGADFKLPDSIYKQILAFCILLSIFRMLFQFKLKDASSELPIVIALIIGGSIGFLSGMLGIGGGIILSPILILFAWASIKESAAISALFIFVNSIAGLVKLNQKGIEIGLNIKFGIVAAIIGGLLGAYYGSQKFNDLRLKYVLAFVLLIACFKLVFSS